jgi:outer membrane protein assembly factor BamD (BamD/ComL family)
LLNAGRTLLRGGDKSGLETLDQVARLYPDSPQARPALLTAAAAYRYQTHQPNKALELYTQFVQRYPDDREVPRVIGYIRDLAAALSAPDPSTTLLREAIRQTADKPEAAARLQLLLDNKGR